MSGSRLFPMILVLAIVGIILASLFCAMLASPPEQNNLPARIEYTTRAPIKIVGDAGFTSANGVTSGTGTPGDPFIINDWEIDATTAIAIDISGTRAYFVIRNCLLKNGAVGTNDGLMLNNVENGTVRNNVIINNMHGIHVQSSSYNLVHANNVSSNMNDGIYLDDSFNNSITNNSCWMNQANGIFLSISNDNIVENNTCRSNLLDGIYLEAASHNLIQWNNCSLNQDDGIETFWNCNSNLFFENVVISNTDYGCSITTNCAGNLIYQNTFIFNRGSSSTFSPMNV